MKTLRPLKKYILDRDKTISYFKENVDGGTNFSRIILEKLDFKEGNFFTLLPNEAILDMLYAFETDSILPQDDVKAIYIKSMKKSFQGRWINSIETELLNYLKKYLLDDHFSSLIFEDVLRESDDKGLTELEKYYRLFNEEVYYIISEKNFTLEALKKIVDNANALWHMLGICFDNRGLNNFQKKLKINDFEQITEKTKLVIIRAYDGAGYLFWENKQATEIED